MYANHKRTIGFALKSRLPSVYNRREDVEAGGLMSYGADLADSYRRVAYYVDRILKGAKPADLPVEHRRVEFVHKRRVLDNKFSWLDEKIECPGNDFAK
jgi:ABC-type uncharacterized transport system substrate-binding protein